MNRIILLFFLLVGIVKISTSQAQFNDSAEVYNYWAKRGLIEATYAYMQDYIKTVGEGKAQAELVSKNMYYEQFIKDIDSKNNLPEFNQISGFLKSNSWSSAEKTLFKPLIMNFEAKNTLDSLFFDCKKPGSNVLATVIPGYENENYFWDETKQEIIKKYIYSLNSLQNEKQKLSDKKTNTFSAENKTGKLSKDIEMRQNETLTDLYYNTYFQWFMIFIVSVLVGFIIGNIWVKNQVKKRIIKIEKDEIHEDELGYSFLGIVYNLKKMDKSKLSNFSKIDQMKTKISRLEDENKSLLDENLNLRDELELLSLKNKKNKAEINLGNSESSNSNISSKNFTKLYFSMPEVNGSFLITNGETSNDGKKYYKIEYEEASNHGEIFYLTSERDQRAINRLESYLKPVCIIENITNATSAKKIELLKSGVVTRLNNYWIIDPDNKIVIRLY